MISRRWMIGYIVCAASAIALAGCQNTVPVVPTLAPTLVLPTQTATPEPSAPAVPLAPTLTPQSTQPEPTAKPATFAPRTPKPNAATQTASAPIGVVNDGGVLVLNITEAQLNAALKHKFDSAPLARYTAAPRATLSDGALVLTLLIIPQDAPADSRPQTMTLVGGLATYDGALELQPIDLSPLDVGVTPRQVKLAHVMLIKTLNDLAIQAAGQPRAVTYNYAGVSPDKVQLTIATIATPAGVSQ